MSNALSLVEFVDSQSQVETETQRANEPPLAKPQRAYRASNESSQTPTAGDQDLQAQPVQASSTADPLVGNTQDVERSRQSSRANIDGAPLIQTWRNPPMNKWRVMSACLGNFGQGFNDSAPGALLPYIERFYRINYAEVSTIFVGNAVGFIVAAFFVHTLDQRLGRAKTLLLCELINIAAFAVLIIPPPFPVFAIGYFLTGYSLATTLALNNVFCANTAPATTVLGALHGSYGIGGTVAPLIATAMVNAGVEFSRFYSILLGIRIAVGICLGTSFWNWRSDLYNGPEEIDLSETSAEPPKTGATTRARSKMPPTLGRALKNRVTLIGALFIFAYQGAEVSISGWVISFLIQTRHGQPSRVGNVTAGFWGGITVGRLLLSPLAQRTGEKLFTWGLILGAVAFEVIVWRLQNVIADSVFIALLGLLLGPIFPLATVVFTRLLPRNIQNTAMAFISSAGSSGGAIAPFVTGLLAQAAGTWVLHPIAIGLYVVMMACWTALPRVPKRLD